MNFFELKDRFISLLYPKTCVLCQRVVSFETLWCGCDMPYSLEEFCFCCGKHGTACFCATTSSPIYSKILSTLYYTGTARSAVIRLKNSPDSRIVTFFTTEMHTKIRAVFPILPFEVVVPVPASEESLRAKGFSHADLLGKSLATSLNLRYYPTFLRRDNDSPKQHFLSTKEREANALSSYHANQQTDGSLLAGQSVLLVDDVCTTGATLRVCAKLLLEHGVSKVYASSATSNFADRKKEERIMSKRGKPSCF